MANAVAHTAVTFPEGKLSCEEPIPTAGFTISSLITNATAATPANAPTRKGCGGARRRPGWRRDGGDTGTARKSANCAQRSAARGRPNR